MMADANALGRLTVVATPRDARDVRAEVMGFPGADRVPVVTEFPDCENAAVVEINRVYVRRQFIGDVRRGKRELRAAHLAPITSSSTLKAAEEFVHKDAPGHRTLLLRLVYRPISRRLAAWLSRTPVTANGVTLLSLGIIPVIAVLTARDHYILGLVAAGLINLVMVLDMVDGDLARLKNSRSRFGAWFDGTVDAMFSVSIASAFGIGAVINTGNLWFAIPAVMWLTGSAATHSNFLHEMIARGGEREYEVAVQDTQGNTPLLVQRVINVGRRARWTLAQPEIVRAIYTIGLCVNHKEAVVLIFATYYTLLVVRMFARAYLEYRRTEAGSARE